MATSKPNAEPAVVHTELAPAGLPTPTISKQNVVYHVYQHAAPAARSNNANIKIPTINLLLHLRPILLGTLWAVWVLYLAGAAKLTVSCADKLNYNGLVGFVVPSDTSSYDFTASDCAYYFSLTWWGVWLQFTTLLGATALLIWKPSKMYTTSIMYFFIMSSVLMFFLAEKYNLMMYVIQNKIKDYSNNYLSGTIVILAGIVGSLILNFVYMIWNSLIEAEKEEETEVDAEAEAVVTSGKV